MGHHELSLGASERLSRTSFGEAGGIPSEGRGEAGEAGHAQALKDYHFTTTTKVVIPP
jgi:hypothetical protein